MEELKDISTDKLINELIQRGAKLVNSGEYCSYRLEKKYSPDRENRRISAKILILPRK